MVGDVNCGLHVRLAFNSSHLITTLFDAKRSCISRETGYAVIRRVVYGLSHRRIAPLEFKGSHMKIIAPHRYVSIQGLQ